MAYVTSSNLTNLNDVVLGDLALNGRDSYGTLWILQGIEGVWTLPPIDLPDAARPGGRDGSYDTVGRFAARLITITGTFIPYSNDTMYAARARMVNTFNLVKTSSKLYFRDGSDEMLVCTVRLLEPPIFVTSKLSGETTFELHLKASDPRRYAITPDSSFTIYNSKSSLGRTYQRTYPMVYNNPSAGPPYTNLATIVNRGNTQTSATITIRGGVTNPVLTHMNTSKTLKFNLTLTQYQFLVVELETKQVLLNGVENMKRTVTLDSWWFMIDPGANTVRFTSDSPELCTAEISSTSAWV